MFIVHLEKSPDFSSPERRFRRPRKGKFGLFGRELMQILAIRDHLFQFIPKHREIFYRELKLEEINDGGGLKVDGQVEPRIRVHSDNVGFSFPLNASTKRENVGTRLIRLPSTPTLNQRVQGLSSCAPTTLNNL
jgi:hypothetical protein